MRALRAALYARTSTTDQHVDAQVDALREFARSRGWTIAGEFVDDGISGATARRPALDRLVDQARRHRVDVVVAWRLDRLGRSVRDLVLLFDELQRLDVLVATVNDGIDLTTPAGRMVATVMSALAEYERTMIRDRVKLGIARARSRGVVFGRPKVHNISARQLARVAHLPLSKAADRLGVSKAFVHKLRKAK